ncbi:glyoxalase [Cohnella xylanilytica]|uniref:VOC family protein n=1 Tax=Cohnella xylanilytica TaxID=557555 RepID=UPI001B256F01|nr:VOC family protein [Cohnella xylanilytica]GIO13673.1 glyoxalase [Cohnella xylanilytica]
MTTKELWINLPVRNVRRSMEFYASLGFACHPCPNGTEEAASLVVGDSKVLVMLFPETTFLAFTGHAVADARGAAEVLLSIDAGSREEVDELVRKAAEAGGFVFGEPRERQGWMYGAGFADPDGHRWTVLHMDEARIPLTE